LNGNLETSIGETPFSLPGDSGSLVRDLNNRVVGLLYGGNLGSYTMPAGAISFACHIADVASAMGVAVPQTATLSGVQKAPANNNPHKAITSASATNVMAKLQPARHGARPRHRPRDARARKCARWSKPTGASPRSGVMSAIRIWWRAVIPRVCSVLERGQLGLQPAGKPLGSFLFLGPTGVGKMELTLEFTRYLFDMSEFLHLDNVVSHPRRR
jgi:hypothetical protein